MSVSAEHDFETARRAARDGDRASAEAAYRRVLEILPDNVEALRFVARCAWMRREDGNSIALLSRAARVEPNNPAVYADLGLAYRIAERFDAGRYVLERSLRLSPDPATRLVLADLLEKDDRGDLALLHFFRALIDAQRMRRWNGCTDVPDLESLIARANTIVRSGRSSFFEGALARVPDVSPRIHEALAMYLGEAPLRADRPNQHAGFLHVPMLSGAPLIDAARCEWICAAHFAQFEKEIDACIAQTTTATFPLLLRGIDQYEARPAPRLVAALHAAPLLTIWNHAPDVEIVRLAAQTSTPVTGRANWRCSAIVNASTTPIDVVCGGQTAIVAPHATVICDTSFGYVLSGRDNASARALILDVWHPDLTAAERDALSALVDATLDFDNRLQELT